MTAEQSMTQTMTQAVIEVAKAAIMAFREAEIPANTARSALAMPKPGGPAAHVWLQIPR